MAVESRFTVGMQYRMLANERSGWFWATCIKRTAKTATFEANENGSRWYMPKFTLRMTKDGEMRYPNGDLDEEMTTRKGSRLFPHGVTAYASEERVKKEEKWRERG